MITRAQYERARLIGEQLLRQAGIAIRPTEYEKIEVADFGLGQLDHFGAQILTLVDSEKIGIKLIALHSGQTLPEHYHPQIENYEGKEETIRCAWGELYLYGPGESTPQPKAVLRDGKQADFTQWSETILQPGDQVTFLPNTPHWFQAGPGGSVVWSFSTKVVDLQDIFTNPEIQRKTVIEEE